MSAEPWDRDRTAAAFGGLDYAFNNGGSGGKARLTAEMDERDWDETIDGPGWVRTPPVERWMRRDPKVARQIIAQEPIGRLGTPEEIAETVIWLCSERATFVVGAALAIDGGYLA